MFQKMFIQCSIESKAKPLKSGDLIENFSVRRILAFCKVTVNSKLRKKLRSGMCRPYCMQ